MFDGYLMNRRFVAQTPKLKEQADKASKELFDFYQMINKEYFERYESDDRDGDL